jgi:hypothetical protein
MMVKPALFLHSFCFFLTLKYPHQIVFKFSGLNPYSKIFYGFRIITLPQIRIANPNPISPSSPDVQVAVFANHNANAAYRLGLPRKIIAYDLLQNARIF